MSHHWGYADSDLPPNKWHEQYSIAKTGNKQSPIDIETCKAKYTCNEPLNICYKSCDVKSVTNNGHSVTFLANGGNSVLSGGPLKSKYTLEQFHFHWGKTSCDGGSEHTVDGRRMAAEMHFVHWNSDKYKTFQDSLEHPDGLCVLGAFIKPDTCENDDFKHVIHNIGHVQLKDDKHEIAHGFDPSTLLPCERSCYHYYEGSLTTPPLKECVQWVMFKSPVLVSENQLNQFRKLHIGGKHSAYLCDNYRPVQELHSRVVSSNNREVTALIY